MKLSRILPSLLLLALLARAGETTGQGNADPVRTITALCGDANADRRLDIADAIRVLSHIFLGGPAPVCNSGPNPCPGPGNELEAMIAERGDPILGLTPTQLFAREGLSPEDFFEAGIHVDATMSYAFVQAEDGTQREVALTSLQNPVDLLYLTMASQEGGEIVEITYRSSSCETPITCDTECKKGAGDVYVSEQAEKDPKKCKALDPPDNKKKCTEKLKLTCTRGFYSDDKCTKKVGKSVEIMNLRCN